MSGRTDTVLDEYGRAVPGASVYVYNADNTDASIFSDKAQLLPIVQPVQTDEFGTFTYYAEDGYYREDIWYGGKLRYRQAGVAIGAVENILIDAVARAENDAAIAAAAAALIGAGGINFTVDSNLVVRPEANGGTNAIGLAAACAAASAAGGEVALSPNTAYTIDREVVVPVGVNIRGPASASIKLRDQITATLTSGFSSGTGAKSFNVNGAQASQFVVGQTVMVLKPDGSGTISPNDSFSHAGRQITAIVNNGGGSYTITIGAGPQVTAHVTGDIMASTCHLLRCLGSNILQGFTVDGNQANNLYAHWITSAMIAQEGDGVRKIGLTFKDTPSDAFLCGGPSGGEVYGSWTLFCKFTNIANNGCHYGNARQIYAFGNRYVGICKRFLLPLEQGGSGPTGRGGHMDGAWIYSNDVADGHFIGNYVEDSICGVGALGTIIGGGAETNDDTIVANNTFVNCEKDLEAILGTKRIAFTGNKCRADYPFSSANGTYAGNIRWTNHQAVSCAGDPADGRIENISVVGNIIKNGCINLDRVRGFQVNGNSIDNRELNASGNSSTEFMGILLYNYEGGVVKGNTVMGSYASLWLQNSNLGANYCRDTLIEGNLFLYPYLRGMSGFLTGPSTLTGTVLRGNIIRGDTAATKEDGSTVIPTDGTGGWRGLTLFTGLQVDHNRIEFNNAGGAAAFDTTIDPATNLARRWNIVNGAFELFSNFANDGAAATGNVAVGGMYRNGSGLQQRVS